MQWFVDYVFGIPKSRETTVLRSEMLRQLMHSYIPVRISLSVVAVSYRMLPPLECDKGESPEEFGRRVQQAIASELHIRKSQATKEDYLEWLAGQLDYKPAVLRISCDRWNKELMSIP